MKGFNNVIAPHGNSTAQKFGYNGIELEESLGLNLHEMEFRQYDAAIGRFTGIDPVTHYDFSPYQAFDNNPILLSDPTGADARYSNYTDVNGRNRYNEWGVYIPASERKNVNNQDGTYDPRAAEDIKLVSKLFTYGVDISNLTESDKEKYFEQDNLVTIGILLHEFATGTGKETREFIYGKHPFATTYCSGRILEELYVESMTELLNIGYDFKNLPDTKKDIEVTLEFSPKKSPKTWSESLRKHFNSNLSQFFVGGSTAKVSIKNQNLMMQVYNETSRRSYYLHLPFVNNYKRKAGSKNKPLSTIKQYINASIKLEKQ